VLAFKAFPPKAVLVPAVVFEPRAFLPNAELLLPVVFASKEL